MVVEFTCEACQYKFQCHLAYTNPLDWDCEDMKQLFKSEPFRDTKAEENYKKLLEEDDF